MLWVPDTIFFCSPVASRSTSLAVLFLLLCHSRSLEGNSIRNIDCVSLSSTSLVLIGFLSILSLEDRHCKNNMLWVPETIFYCSPVASRSASLAFLFLFFFQLENIRLLCMPAQGSFVPCAVRRRDKPHASIARPPFPRSRPWQGCEGTCCGAYRQTGRGAAKAVQTDRQTKQMRWNYGSSLS